MPYKILVVEDNEMNLDVLVRRLERKGFEIITAVDGQASIDMATEAMPDLIIMDWSLPGIDGIEATRQIKSNEKTSKIPIIILSAHAMVGDSDTALSAGCDDYETKPVEFPRLIAKIEKLIGATKST